MKLFGIVFSFKGPKTLGLWESVMLYGSVDGRPPFPPSNKQKRPSRGVFHLFHHHKGASMASPRGAQSGQFLDGLTGRVNLGS